ncbi:hypothetical protein ACFLTU_10615, partial [Bacteroidota bacterium]
IDAFPYGVYTANIEIAAEVAVLAGCDRKVALKSIVDSFINTESDFTKPLELNRNTFFLNAFTVNDTDSASDFYNYWSEKLDIKENIAFVLNTRSDRPLRTYLFSEWIKERAKQCKFVFITGDHREMAYRKLKCLIPEVEIRKIRSKQVKGILDTINSEFADTKLIIGIGNIKGEGYKVINEFNKAS